MYKYKIIVLTIFIIIINTITQVKADTKLIGKTIYIDPGHGGKDPGAIYKELKELKINLQIALELKQELEKNGAKVYMARIGDYDISNINTTNHKKNDLSARAKLINESECDMFISIHLNSDPSPTWSGIQVFYTNKNKNNKEIAEITQKKFKEELKSTRKAKQIKNMYLFDRIEKPGILIEAGFISNSNDRYLLKQKEYQKRIAMTINKSIKEYYK